MSKIVKIGLFFTHSESLIGKVTVASTISLKELFKRKEKDLATHTGIWFEDSKGEVVFFEALMDKGWTGPEPISKIFVWASDNQKRRFRLYDATILSGYTVGDIERRYEMAVQRKGVWKYSKAQLGLHLRFARLLRSIFGRTFFKPSTDVIICSEAAAQFVDNPPYFDALRACGVPDFDLIDPAMLERAIVKAGAKLIRQNMNGE